MVLYYPHVRTVPYPSSMRELYHCELIVKVQFLIVLKASILLEFYGNATDDVNENRLKEKSSNFNEKIAFLLKITKTF